MNNKCTYCQDQMTKLTQDGQYLCELSCEIQKNLINVYINKIFKGESDYFKYWVNRGLLE